MSETDEREETGTRKVVSDAMADALAREAVGLAALALILLAMDPRVRIWLTAAGRRLARMLRGAPRPDIETAVAKLRADISDYEHAQKRDGGCGCV
jgi:hypothetical protein